MSSQLDALAADYTSLTAIQATQAQLRQARTRLDTLHRVSKQLVSTQEGHGVIHVPLAPKAFLPARPTGANVRLRVPTKPQDGEISKGKEKEVNEEDVDLKSALEMLALRRKGVEMELTLLRRKLDALLRSTTGAESVDELVAPSTTLGTAASSKQPLTTLEALTQVDGATEVDAQGRVLNEEGLPFVDVVEPATEEEEGAGTTAAAAAAVKEQQPRSTMSAEERKRWMEDVFAKLSQEEEAELNASDEEDASDVPKVVPPGTPSRSASATEAASSSPPTTPIPHSSARPAPRRSALKRTHSNASSNSGTPGVSSSIPPLMALARTPPKFGAAGVRRGFLNLNPFSPAAERSSDPIAAAGAALASVSSSTSVASPSVAALKLASQQQHARESSTETSTSTDDEDDFRRMSRSEELPGRGSKKKHVRIMSPTRTRSRSPLRRRFARGGRPLPPWQTGFSSSSVSSSSGPASQTGSAFATTASQPREAEDVGVEEEARRIVELLGPAVVKGHPNAPANLDALQRAKEEEDRARLAKLRGDEEEFDVPTLKREAKKPVMQQTVFERTPFSAAPSPVAAVNDSVLSAAAKPSLKPSSGSKRGFLNRAAAGPPKSGLSRSTAAAAAASSSSAPPLPDSPATLPAAPRASHGVSALERSLRFDEDVDAAREARAEELKPPLPHARPSKAFAAKLEARKRGEVGEVVPSSESKAQEAEEEANEVGEGTVRFASRPVQDEQKSKGKGKETVVGFADSATSAPQDNEGEEYSLHLTGDAMGFTDARPRVDHAGDLSDEEHRPYASSSDSEEEAEWDSDEDSLDLDELAPSFSALASDFETADLAREYELAKAQLEGARERAALAMLGGTAARDAEEEEGDDEEDDGYVPLDHGVEEKRPGARKPSRFRASRVARAAGYEVPRSKQLSSPAPSSNRSAKSTMQDEDQCDDVDEATRRADEAGHELAHLLESAQNVGPQSSRSDNPNESGEGNTGIGAGAQGIRPVMVIPSLAPVRYPRNARQLLSGDDDREAAPGPVALEEDEVNDYEEEKEEGLMDVMRARLQAREQNSAARSEASTAQRSTRRHGDTMKPPPVVTAKVREKKQETLEMKQAVSVTPQPEVLLPRKVSRFKAARQAQQ